MIVCGDSANIIPTLADESVDLIVTDPPYGIKFMGRAWDKAVPSVAIWRECLRVLKPGAFAFVMSGPRMDCLSEMGKRLAEAGFETGFTPIFWAYASGFPKAANMGKLVDKRLGAEREVIAHKHSHYPDTNHGGDRRAPNRERFVDGGPMPGSVKATSQEYIPITAPATPEAQALDGSYAGFQPKPSVEVVIVAMKPLAHGTYIDQALDNRKGVTWLDEGRIPYDGQVPEIGKPSWGGPKKKLAFMGDGPTVERQPPNQQGRFPANLLVSDDAVDDGQGHKSSHGGGHRQAGESCFGLGKDGGRSQQYWDSGGFSRYFSLDKWWQAKLSELPEFVQRTFPFLVVPKAGKKEKNLGCESLQERIVECLEGNKDGTLNKRTKGQPSKSRNYHPTVKPLKLMSYLVTLGSRPGDLVLDPFAGTCTTGIAAKMLGRNYLMVEIDEQWCRIGRRRVEAAQERML